MSTREIRKHDLDFEKTIAYFIDHINCDKTLSERILKKIDFRQGSFFTLLPANADLNRLYKFPSGRIIPPIPYDEHSQKVITMDLECCEFISTYLQENEKNCAVVENYELASDSPHVMIPNIRMIPYKRDVYLNHNYGRK